MAKIVIVATKRYSINACDFDLLFRKTRHEIVSVVYHQDVSKKPWFKTGKPCPSNRNGVATALADLPRLSYKHKHDLVQTISRLGPDYVAIGNGHDDDGLHLRAKWQGEFLFAEYGWMPWANCFYIDKLGVGPKSSIRGMGDAELAAVNVNHDEIKAVEKSLRPGKPCKHDDFIYVPLQVDSPTSDGKPDFKFKFTSFKDNIQFVAHVLKIAKSLGKRVVVKQHPSSPLRRDFGPDVVDISDLGISKYETYARMYCCMLINSTTAIEAMVCNKPVIAYGDDLFSGKSIVMERPSSAEQVEGYCKNFAAAEMQQRFVSLLLERQIDRKKCADRNYVNGHYWTKSL